MNRVWNLASEQARKAFWDFMKERVAAQQSVVVRLVEDTRSLDQNAYSHAIYGQVAAQLEDQTAREVKAECKLIFGVPILMEDEKFRAKWQSAALKLTHEERLGLMDFMDVTSLMNVRQFTQYLDEIVRHYTRQGLYLAKPWED